MKFDLLVLNGSSTAMSGIRMKTEMTENERSAVHKAETLYPPQTGTILKDPLDTKLLLCILETLQDIKQELTELRHSNEQMRSMVNGLIDTRNNAVRNVNIMNL